MVALTGAGAYAAIQAQADKALAAPIDWLAPSALSASRKPPKPP